jgi:hypothetical protein
MAIEQRRTPRWAVSGAVTITPNGAGHETEIFDISVGGARVGLPDDWTHADGAPLRMFFQDDIDCPVMLRGHVTRVAVNHLGLAFEPAQERRISELMQLFR